MNLLQFKSATAKRAGRLSRGNIVSASAVASAQNLALAYLQDKRYPSNDHRVDTLIRRESSKNFASGGWRPTPRFHCGRWRPAAA